MNPIAVTIFGIDIRWYGVFIAIGVLAALYFAKKNSKIIGLNPEFVENYLLIALIPGIIGARLYYVIFNYDYYVGDFFKIINIRSGGLAIHGGLIVGGLIAVFYCMYKKISIIDFMDILASAVPLAQSIGRWGNYANSEAHGGPTDLPWAIVVDSQKVHPTFLYESIWTFGIFLLLNYILRKNRFSGKIFSLYMILYSAGRFFIEGLRTDSLYLGNIKVAQLVSAISIILGIIVYVYFKKKDKNGLLS